METSSFKVAGASAGDLPDALADALGVTALVKHGGVTVLCHEKYYMRIDSNLMSTIVLSQKEEGVCFVDIVTGGGKYSVFGLSFGAEKRNTDVVSEALASTCQRLNLAISAS